MAATTVEATGAQGHRCTGLKVGKGTDSMALVGGALFKDTTEISDGHGTELTFKR